LNDVDPLGLISWTCTNNKSNVQNAYDHWTKHKGEFPEFNNAVEYVEGAESFTQNPPSSALSKTRPNGDTVFYDPPSNTFAVQDAGGDIKTMFRPDPAQHGYPTNMDYYSAQ
jgi:filamentous hemagglutinin